MKKILALFLAVMFVFSAMPVYAAEVESVTIEPRVTVCNVANYLPAGNTDIHQFTITTGGKYTVTVVVNDNMGQGAWVRFKHVQYGDKFSETISGRYQLGVVGNRQLNLPAGTYYLNVTANENLSYSITINN